jgi:hypothetical protein
LRSREVKKKSGKAIGNVKRASVKKVAVKRFFRISKEDIGRLTDLVNSYEDIGIVTTMATDWPCDCACIECIVPEDFVGDFEGVIKSVVDRYRILEELREDLSRKER